jgi:hypothetical protein
LEQLTAEFHESIVGEVDEQQVPLGARGLFAEYMLALTAT